MVRRRISLSALVSAAYAASIWAAHRRWDGTASGTFIVLTVLEVALLLWVLGRPLGAMVAVVTADALNRYTVEIAGATFKPEHLVAPLVAVVLLPGWRQALKRLDPASWLLLAWLGWSAVGGALNAPQPDNSARLWAMLLLVAFGYFALTTTIGSPSGLRAVVQAWLLTGIGVGLFGLMLHTLNRAGVDLGVQVNPVTRDPTIPSTFYESNLFGSAMTMVSLAGVALLSLGSTHRWTAWTAALVAVLGLEVSYARGAWIAYLAGLILLMLIAVTRMLAARRLGRRFHRPKSGLCSLTTLYTVAAVGTVLLWLPAGHRGVATVARVPAAVVPIPEQPLQGSPAETPAALRAAALAVGTPRVDVQVGPVTANEPDILARIASIADFRDQTYQIRWEFSWVALQDWGQHPILGLGIGSFGQRYVSADNRPAWIGNVVVRLLHDGGIVGFLLFALALALLATRTVSFLRHPRGSETETLALALAVANAAMFVAFLATEGLQIAWYWFGMGLFAVAVRLEHARRRP